MSERCPICGETAPEPASLCIPRAVRIAESGKPCDYSREGEARFAAELGQEKATLISGLTGETKMDDDYLLADLRSLARVLDTDSSTDYATAVRQAVIEIVRLRAEVRELGKLAVSQAKSTSATNPVSANR
ncbi:hypothetical protein [Methylobacterium sp. XJLW]|uniref:hypothetical protein n=1 Tax=Methylobacterium sp. XJLW TaxID=739141 RepID=UPI000F557FF3|nr:hypothetical protein [Methylobacterium sp. XJLW]